MAATTAAASQPGTTLGKFELLRHLARGGMANLYLARAHGIEGFQKLAVVKQILPKHTDDPEFVRMFIEEARLAATLQHPNIVQVFDIGESNGLYFFAMEYIHGKDLARILRRTYKTGARVPLEHAVHLVRDVAAGLQYAHQKESFAGQPLELVHRDVSPQNVLVSYDGAIKLADFGIAKSTAGLAATRIGVLKGKLGYMSPEQALSQPVDRRSDVFSACILLWELVTGRGLFHRSEGELQILKAVTETDAPAASTVVRDVPKGLDRILARGLARDREKRFATAEELQLALEELAAAEKLTLSSVALGRYMKELFQEETARWLAAQQAGKSFVAYLLEDEAEPPPDLELGHFATQPALPTEQVRRRWRRGAALGGAALALGLGMTALVWGAGSGSAPLPAVPTPPPVAASVAPSLPSPVVEAHAQPGPPRPAARPPAASPTRHPKKGRATARGKDKPTPPPDPDAFFPH